MSVASTGPVPSSLAPLYPAEVLTAVLRRATNTAAGIHGPSHWAAVAEHGAQLAADTPGADSSVVRLFALLHDAMRENDGHDPEHGPRAATLAEQLFPRLGLTDDQLQLLATALEAHDRGETSDDPTIGCCWDADRLDLPRVGARLDLRYFSTTSGRERAEFIRERQ